MNERTAYVAAGCFWGVEAFFRRVEGVLDTECGYANGHAENPSYEQVCAGDTGHTEAVRVRYDAEALPLARLIDAYFSIIDITAKAPVQYHNALYMEDCADLSVCQAALEALCEAQGAKDPAVIAEPLRCFYPAEDYHQDYMELHPEAHCHIDLSRFKERALRGM